MYYFQIKYGIAGANIDITDKCYNLSHNDIIKIQFGDIERACLFGDPISNVVKQIFISDEYGETYIFNDATEIEINLKTNTVSYITSSYKRTAKKLEAIHNQLQLAMGNMLDEYPEQIMATKYLTGYEKVLEIGGNIGRNTLVIAHILKQKNNNNLVSLESSKNISKQLEHNRDINGFDFYIENSALSKRKLIQNGWNTIPSDIVLEGYELINTITFEDLINKYNITFNTLVLDCEGAFYFILQDMPEILNDINMIIMENDYLDISHKQYIDNILMEHGFYRDFVMSGGWGPCYLNFYEVWKK